MTNPPETTYREWIVVIGKGVWARCYGTFASYDDVIAWVRRNQFDVADASAHPIYSVDAPKDGKAAP